MVPGPIDSKCKASKRAGYTCKSSTDSFVVHRENKPTVCPIDTHNPGLVVVQLDPCTKKGQCQERTYP